MSKTLTLDAAKKLGWQFETASSGHLVAQKRLGGSDWAVQSGPDEETVLRRIAGWESYQARKAAA